MARSQKSHHPLGPQLRKTADVPFAHDHFKTVRPCGLPRMRAAWNPEQSKGFLRENSSAPRGLICFGIVQLSPSSSWYSAAFLSRCGTIESRASGRVALSLSVRALVRQAAPYCRQRTPSTVPPPRRAGANHLLLFAGLRRSSSRACTITSLIAFAAFGILGSGSLTYRDSAHGCEKRFLAMLAKSS
jgi:hypothetical protein